MDAVGISTGVTGAVLAPAREPGLANGEGSPAPSACCWAGADMLPVLSAFVLVSFLGLVYGGSDVPSDGPLLCVILLLEDILLSLPINSNTYRILPDNLVSNLHFNRTVGLC